MAVRLAFAVAAHLEPEILIVDEVLAVGDASFQRKCLNKMEGVRAQGRTILFVSHSMPAVTRLCSRVMLLDSGTVVADGPAHEVVTKYLRSGVGTTAAREWPDPTVAPGDDVVRLRAVRVRNAEGQVTTAADIRRPVGIEIAFDVLKPDRVLVPNLHFFNDEGVCLFVAPEVQSPWFRRPRPVGRHLATAWIPGNFLSEGTVIVDAAISTMDPVNVHVHERDAVAFQVVDSLEGDSVRGDYGGAIPGAVRPMLRWEVHTPPAVIVEAHT
jgi:lipopolysaccharide transport system ATP-binding protein